MLRRRVKEERDSTQALNAANQKLQEVKDRHCEIKEVSSSLRRLREHNHFAEQLQIIMGGRR